MIDLSAAEGPTISSDRKSKHRERLKAAARNCARGQSADNFAAHIPIEVQFGASQQKRLCVAVTDNQVEGRRIGSDLNNMCAHGRGAYHTTKARFTIASGDRTLSIDAGARRR